MNFKSNKVFVTGIFMWILFALLHVSIRLLSYESSINYVDYIMSTLLTVTSVLLLLWSIVSTFDLIEDMIDILMRNCVKLTGILCVMFVIFYWLEMCSDGFSVYQYTDICIWGIELSKECLIDIFAIILFPLFLEVVFKALYRDGFCRKSSVLGCILVLILTVLGILVFGALDNVRLVNLMLLNIIAIVNAFYKYIWFDKGINRKTVALVLGYVFVCLILLIRYDTGKGVIRYLYGSNWNDYAENVNVLTSQAAFLGTSSDLLEAGSVHYFLLNRSNFIHQLLFYGGWMFVSMFIVLLFFFVITIMRMVDFQRIRLHKHYLIYTQAFCLLCIRCVVGVLYSFALVPYPISLPFAGTMEIVTDTVALAILFMCAYENHRITRIEICEAVSVEDYLGRSEVYSLLDKDTGEAYTEEFFFDRLYVAGAEKKLLCSPQWVCLTESDSEMVVFEPVGKNKVFILECYDDGKGKPVGDEELIQEIMKEYKAIKLSQYGDDELWKR